ncbi:universal stress protein [Vagococcus acidifermentans]|uniref:Universal stress protein n=1 Tax=Vagococcus acidifermentans TaxID=564710 RepID=A0A430AZ92_9ENTE|nr:universal stress protein [Vagococcus acidifermentans]RSU13391.1 hypothetical protein CBF27_04215 [Vagococcus acidifermentans]
MAERYKQILVAYDGSEQAGDALEEAAVIAKHDNSKLVILYVFESDALLTSTNPAVLTALETHHQEEVEMLKKILQKKIERAALPETHTVKLLTVRGRAKHEILTTAQKENVDLIVMGATGTHAVERAFVGSTTAYVVNHAQCHVLVVR